MTYATPEDVLSRWIGGENPAPVETIQKYLDDAELILEWEIPDLDRRIEKDPGTEARVILVESRMVIRALKNPDLKRQTAHTTGPFTESSTYGAETLTGLTVTSEDIALLEGALTKPQQAFTITSHNHISTHALEHSWVNGPARFAPGSVE